MVKGILKFGNIEIEKINAMAIKVLYFKRWRY